MLSVARRKNAPYRVYPRCTYSTPVTSSSIRTGSTTAPTLPVPGEDVHLLCHSLPTYTHTTRRLMSTTSDITRKAQWNVGSRKGRDEHDESLPSSTRKTRIAVGSDRFYHALDHPLWYRPHPSGPKELAFEKSKWKPLMFDPFTGTMATHLHMSF